MITEDQKKKYEEAGFQYWLSKLGELADATPAFISRSAFLAGAEHAHPIAHSEGKKEGWNQALDEAINTAENHPFWFQNIDSQEAFIEILQKLRK